MKDKTEQELDNETAVEMQAISDMLANAGKHNLTVEVIWSLCHNLASSVDIGAECVGAQCEWDI